MQILSNWEEYASIKKWKKGLTHNSNRKKFSESTQHSIKHWMPFFLEFTQKTPDQLIEEALTGKDAVRERLSDFFNWLQDEKGKKYNASVQGAYSIIRGFYSHNDINTQKIRTPKLEPTNVQFSDDNVPLFEIVERDGKKRKQIRREFLKEFFEILSNRDKLIALCLISSGLDSGDILSIPIATIKYQNQDRIFIRSLRSKTGETVSTFFSKEASKLIRRHIQLNRRSASDSDTIFVKRSRHYKSKNYKNEFEPLDAKSLASNFREAAKKYLRGIQDEKQNPLRPKRFRKVFSNACDDAGIPTDIKRVFMGKRDPSNKTYEDKDRQDLELYYERIEPNLTILTEPNIHSDNIIEKQSNKIKELETKLDDLQKEHLKSMKEIPESIRDLVEIEIMQIKKQNELKIQKQTKK